MTTQFPFRKNSWRYTTFLAIALFVGVAILVYWRYQIQRDAYFQLNDRKYGVKIVSPDSERAVTQRQEEFIAHAKIIREKIRPWVERNRNLVEKMRKGSDKDVSGLMAVYQSFPGWSRELGITGEEMFLRRPVVPAGPGAMEPILGFSWKPIKTSGQVFADSQSMAQFEKGEQVFRDSMLRDYQAHRDFAVVQSMSPGRSSITVWLSGRITETTKEYRKAPGQNWLQDGQIREIVPAFDVLR